MAIFLLGFKDVPQGDIFFRLQGCPAGGHLFFAGLQRCPAGDSTVPRRGRFYFSWASKVSRRALLNFCGAFIFLAGFKGVLQGLSYFLSEFKGVLRGYINFC